MFESIRHQLMVWFDERRTSENQTTGLLVKKGADHLEFDANTRGRRYRAVPSESGALYEITSFETQRNYIVDLENRTCACSVWKSSGYPCGHAINVLLKLKLDRQEYVQDFFKLDAYKNTYKHLISPLDLANVTGDAVHDPPSPSTARYSDSESGSEDSDATDSDSVLPSSTRRPPGRPKNHGIRGQHKARPKHVFTCSRCGATGHSKNTCREPINHGVGTPRASASKRNVMR